MGQSNSQHDDIVNCSNDFELVVRAAKELEFLLETKFSASSGKQSGLHEKISSARQPNGEPLPDKLVRKMRFLATLRNQLIHDRDCNEIPDKARFRESFKEAVGELRSLCPSAKAGEQGCLIA